MEILQPIKNEITIDDIQDIINDFKIDLKIQIKEYIEDEINCAINNIIDESIKDLDFDGLIYLLYKKKLGQE